jgi:hypothetical protein
MSKASNINSTKQAVRSDYAERAEGRDRRRVRRLVRAAKSSWLEG